jgi:hypothetical protein
MYFLQSFSIFADLGLFFYRIGEFLKGYGRYHFFVRKLAKYGSDKFKMVKILCASKTNCNWILFVPSGRFMLPLRSESGDFRSFKKIFLTKGPSTRAMILRTVSCQKWVAIEFGIDFP